MYSDQIHTVKLRFIKNNIHTLDVSSKYYRFRINSITIKIKLENKGKSLPSKIISSYRVKVIFGIALSSFKMAKNKRKRMGFLWRFNHVNIYIQKPVKIITIYDNDYYNKYIIVVSFVVLSYCLKFFWTCNNIIKFLIKVLSSLYC